MNAAIKLGIQIGSQAGEWILKHPAYLILAGFLLMSFGGITIQQSKHAKAKFLGGILIAVGMVCGSYGFWNFVQRTYFL